MPQSMPVQPATSNAPQPRLSTATSRLAESSGPIIATLITFLVSAFAFLVIIILAIQLLKSRDQGPVCKLRICEWYGDEIKRSRDLTVQPCDNFYQHVCGGFNQLQRISVKRRLLDLFEINVQKNIRNETSSGQLQSEMTKALLLYESCVAVLKNTNDEMGLLRSILREATVSWPHRNQSSDILAATLFLNAKWYLNSVFLVRPISEASPGGISIEPYGPFKLLMKTWRDKQKTEGTAGVERYRAYFDVLVRHYRVEGPTMTFEELKSYEDTILPSFEEAFSLPEEVIVSNLSHVATLTHPVTEDRWKTQLTKFYNFSTGTDVIVIKNVAFFKAFFNQTAAMGEIDMTLYVGWVVAQMTAVYVNNELIVNYYGNLMAAELTHQQWCFYITEVLMGPAFTAAFLNSIVTDEVFGDIVEMIRNIRDATVDVVSPNAMLQNNITFPSYAPNTFGRALEFVNSSKPSALSRAYAHFGLMTNSILINLKTVKDGLRSSNVAQSSFVPQWDHPSPPLFQIIPKELDFLLRTYAVTPPLFRMESIWAIKYGGLGYQIALAFSSLLVDREVAKSDARTTELERVARCLSEKKSPTELTASDWAELAALIALRAVLTAKESSHRHVNDLIDGLRLTGKQTFFVIWCYIQCHDSDAERLCNRPLQRTTSFSKAFHCGDDSGMTTKTTCGLF